MNEKQPWFVAERGLALASLLLTSRRDVLIQHSPRESSGLDILAEVLKDGVSAGRFFGVQVSGRVDLPDVREIAGELSPQHRNETAAFTIPVCAFLFDVRKNQGFYQWVVEPTLGDGGPKLNGSDAGQWHKLDERTLRTLVERVAAWYDALAARLHA